MAGAPHPEHEEQYIMEVPAVSAELVAMPCIVRNVDRALVMMGGQNGIDSALFQTGPQQAQSLQIRLRPNDPYAHHLLAERNNCKRMLMKIRRHKTSGHVKVSLHSRILTQYDFNGLADYQFVQQPRALSFQDTWPRFPPIGQATRPLQEHPDEPFGQPQQWMLSPPFFSKLDVPQRYWYRQHLGGDRERQGARMDEADASLDLPPHLAMEPQLPPGLPQEVQDAAHQVLQLLQQRPVWPLSLLDEQEVMQRPGNIGLHLVEKLTYYFPSGPWRDCRIVRGYDPRMNPAGHVYQVVHTIAPQEWVAKVLAQYEASAEQKQPKSASSVEHLLQQRDQRSSSTYASLCALNVVPIRQVSQLCLCDVSHPRVRAVLDEGQHVGATCSGKSGWLTEDGWDELVAVMQEAIQAACDSTDIQLLVQELMTIAEEVGNAAPDSKTPGSSRPRSGQPTPTPHTGTQKAKSTATTSQGAASAAVQLQGMSLGDSGGANNAAGMQVLQVRSTPLAAGLSGSMERESTGVASRSQQQAGEGGENHGAGSAAMDLDADVKRTAGGRMEGEGMGGAATGGVVMGGQDIGIDGGGDRLEGVGDEEAAGGQQVLEGLGVDVATLNGLLQGVGDESSEEYELFDGQGASDSSEDDE